MSINNVNEFSPINQNKWVQNKAILETESKNVQEISREMSVGVSAKAITKTGGVQGGNALSTSANITDSVEMASSMQRNVAFTSAVATGTLPNGATYVSDNITVRNSSFKVHGCIPSKSIAGHPDNNIFITGTSQERKYITCSSSGCRECNVAGSPEGSGGHESLVDVVKNTKGEAYIELNFKKEDFDNNYGRIDFKLRMTESNPDLNSKYSVRLMYGLNEISKIEVVDNEETQNDIILSAYAEDFVGTSTYDERMLHVEISAEIENGGEIGFGCAELNATCMDKYEVYEDKVSRGIPAVRPPEPEVPQPPVVVPPPEEYTEITLTDEEYEAKFESEYNPSQMVSIMDSLISDEYLSEYIVAPPSEIDEEPIIPRKPILGLDPSRNVTRFYFGSDNKAYTDESGNQLLAADSIIAVDNKYFRIDSKHECVEFTPKKVVGYLNKVPKNFISIDNLSYDPVNFSRPVDGTAIIGGDRCFLMINGVGVEIFPSDPRHPFYKGNSSGKGNSIDDEYQMKGINGEALMASVTNGGSVSKDETDYMGEVNLNSSITATKYKPALTVKEQVRIAIHIGVNRGLYSALASKGIPIGDRQEYSEELKSTLVKFAKGECEDNRKAWCDFALSGRYNLLDAQFSALGDYSIEVARAALDRARSVFKYGEERGASINECISEASTKVFIELQDFNERKTKSINDIKYRSNIHVISAHKGIDDQFNSVSSKLVENMNLLKVSTYRDKVTPESVAKNYGMGILSELSKMTGDAIYNTTTKEGQKVLKKFVVDAVCSLNQLQKLKNLGKNISLAINAFNPDTAEGKAVRAAYQDVLAKAPKAIDKWINDADGNKLAFKAGEFTADVIVAVLTAAAGAGMLSQCVKLGKFANYAEKIADRAGDAKKIADDIVKGVGKANFSKSVIHGMKSFMDDIGSILSKHGLSLDKFNDLRLKLADKLTDNEIRAMKAIRESIPDLNNNSIMQKVLPKEDIAKYLDGSYNTVGGYVTRAQDVKQLNNYQDVFDSLRLDYKGTKFKPESDNVLGIIRFKTPEASKIKPPYCKEFGGDIKDGPPFTGNGFTSATNGQIIPEYKCGDYLKLTQGSELYELTKDGKEVLKAVYDDLAGRFIKVQ